MAKKTNWKSKEGGNEYYRINRKVGMKLKDGIWVDDYRCFYGSCKSDAERKYNDYMKSLKNNSISPKACLGEVIDEWIDKVFKNSDLKNSTKSKYIRDYSVIFKESKAGKQLIGRPIESIAPLQIQEIYNNCDRCYSSIRSAHNLLVHFFKYADLNGICRNLTTSLQVPKEPAKRSDIEEIEVWEDEPLKRVISELDGNTLRLLVVLAVNTGARFSELLALTYDDIRDGMLYITKQLADIADVNAKGGKKSDLHIEETKTESSNRVIPLSAPVMAEIEKHRKLQAEEMKKHRQTGHKDIYTDCTGIGEALQALKMGCGVAVGVEVFINGSHVGGHEVTMWGAVTNEAYSPDEAAYYDMIIISDSDSDKNDYSYTDRRQAKNEYDLYRLSYFEGTAYGEQCTSLSYYDGVNVCMLYDYDYLIPYSDDIETETDAQATKNKTTTPDAAVRKVFLSDSETGGEFTDEFMLGDTVYITPTIENVGDYVFTCSSGHKLTATISGTNWSAQKTFRSTLRPSTLITMFTFSASGLKKGDYTLTVQFDADRRVEEAYYYNNTYTMDFSVVTDPTKYLSGDTDDDWDISVLDATKIQKILAMIEADPDGKCSVRGDVFGEGLNILSATAIQKYLANLDYGAADIGSIKSYETGDA